jgi:hypothetical protein
MKRLGFWPPMVKCPRNANAHGGWIRIFEMDRNQLQGGISRVVVIVIVFHNFSFIWTVEFPVGWLLNLRHANIAGVTQNPKNRQKPDDNANHDDDVENLLNFSVHRDIGVYQPKQHANDNQRYDERN